MLRQAMATARLTRLITQDTITEPLRDRAGEVHPLVRELVGCNWCAGIWAAAAVLVLDRTAPAAVDTLAVAQVGFMAISAAALRERIKG